MMIKLNVCGYCQNCLEFKPIVAKRPNLLFENGVRCNIIGDTIVECENKYKCKTLYNNLKKEIDNE